MMSKNCQSGRAFQRLQALSNHFTAKSGSLVDTVLIGDDKAKYPEVIDHKPNLKVGQRFQRDIFSLIGLLYTIFLKIKMHSRN